MLNTINFDIIFVIVFIGLFVGAFLKKSRKVNLNFLFFLISLALLGGLVYFDVDKYLFQTGASFFTKMFGLLPEGIINANTYGIVYMGFLLILLCLIFALFKFFAFLTRYEKSKYKHDNTYTSAHHPASAVIVSIVRYALVLYLFIVALILINPVLGFDLNNSYVITTFQKFDPVVKYLATKGEEVLKVILGF